MKYNFCTLFDSNYLSRGLALYDSLYRQLGKNFCLYIFAFDDECLQYLKRINLEYAVIVSLSEFEDEELLKVKDTRTAGEYCWTCTPSIIRYAINQYGLDMCTYLDSDLYFFGNPKELFGEMSDEESILITEHGYAKKYAQDDTCGKYCVQFVTFKNTHDGMVALEWWRERCIEWCYNRCEDSRFGDQKYLDDWTERFKGVHVLRHIGSGVAPWNSIRFDIYDEKKEIWLRDKETDARQRLIFFHFHGLSILRGDYVCLSKSLYDFSKECIEMIYCSYINTLLLMQQKYRLSDKCHMIKKNNQGSGRKSYDKYRLSKNTYVLYDLLKKAYAPLVIFVYNREEKIKKCIEALRKTVLVDKTDIYIFADGPKNEKDVEAVNRVRKFINQLPNEGCFKNINIIERESNIGLANSVISGVSEVIEKYGKVIVVEDDLVVSERFLIYMNEALAFYQRNKRIGSVAAYSPNIKKILQYKKDLYFTRKGECWGWGTWLETWIDCDWQVKDYSKFKKNKIKRWSFNTLQKRISIMLDKQQEGKNNSWAVRWVYYLYKKRKLTVYPKISLVQNIGMDESGQHCVKTNLWDVNLSKEENIQMCRVHYSPILEHEVAIHGYTTLRLKVKKWIEKVLR